MDKFFQIFRIPDLRNKILFVLFILLVFRLMAVIPIPGIDAVRLKGFLESNQLFGFFNIFSGGALTNLSIMMLGVAPYITATIIMQLLTMIFPALKQMYYEEGAVGRAKFNRYSRYLTVPLAALQSYGFLNLLISQGVLGTLTLADTLRNVVLITAGSMILVWFGELITEKKIGNGVSLIIFAGIVSGLPNVIRTAILSYNPSALPTYAAFIILSIVVIAGVVFVNQGERKIPISYSRRVRGNKMYGGAASYLPLKVNQAGVIPIIFAISILLFPQFFAQIVSIISPDLSLRLNDLVSKFLNNQFVYGGIYFALVIVFTYFYTAVTFDPQEISKNLQRSGGFIPGIRPGEPSGDFLSKIVKRITLFGAIFLGAIAVLPILTQIFTGIKTLTIGGTALLIVVSVAIETMKQIDSQMVMREYEGIQ
ncbi:MAG: preprotein translocase subunit SecY [Candidatus Harrisonbacteria bacterium RIFCSPHIGHO2_01_FULL_44_13]|uniref:Protein translocase subunit SecY n=1 Tax=Candidatus Harrisonbacteria bacterium RIFCSPLOWO2_01_FULL_44_18 TaxID=1798407 RepID=A0A1G1ZMT3_9BACT|nr:MAG: preprotein translocase subunit SecY [Candidatus Harrisonbacteria bacterium RIFCSPHIGHO2_01_FULL_44_13]OGY65963.1 MAG: preprotein translocase subunit SecY [Candidatus Harrisonbacteria bacterium RIFCSPLOWO2_01_FULL_44_18]